MRRPRFELLEGRLLLAIDPYVVPTIFYDYVEDGTLKGGKIDVDPLDPHHAAVGPLEESLAWDVTTIVDNGPAANRIDLVLVGDGYTAADLPSYAGHVDGLLPRFFGQSPLDAYSTFFNVHRVDVISNESGVDNDPTEGIQRDTALDMRFFCGGTQRLLCVNVGKALAAAGDAPDVDQVLALANSTKYGGAGYSGSNLGTLSGGNGAAVELALHEFGHSFANLADEYDYGGDPDYNGPEPSRRNVSIYQAAEMANRQTKWHLWLDEPNVDTFEGAMHHKTGVYRPTDNSKMRNLNRPFEQVNVEQFVREAYQTVRPIDDATAPGSYDQTTVFFVDPVDPLTHSLDVQWYLDGSPIPGAVEATLDASTLGLLPGTYTLEALVVDNTELVRDEALRATRMTERRTWTLSQTRIQIRGTIFNDLDGDGTRHGEPGIDGVTVTLYRDDGDAAFEPGGDDAELGSRITAGGGGYAFDSPDPGDYWVVVDYSTIPLGSFVPTWGKRPLLAELTAGEDAAADFGFREHSGPLTVTTDDDEDDGDYSLDDVSLREALLLAAVAAGDDAIRFDPTLDGGTITLDPALGQLAIDSNVQIEGPGELTVALSSHNVFDVSSGATVTIGGLTVRGGGVLNAGVMTLADCQLYGEPGVVSPQISNTGQTTVTGCTLWGSFGGGVVNFGTMSIANGTISGNSADGVGAGIFNRGTLTVTNTTVFGNQAWETGGGIFIEDGSVTLHNTIVAGNFPDDVGGPLSPEDGSSHNLIGGNPMLGPLADNGGPTLTHAPLPASPAVDAGSNDRATDAGLGSDQRGLERFADGDGDGTAEVDVGAVELVPAAVVGRHVFYNDSVFDDAPDGDGTADLIVTAEGLVIDTDGTTISSYTIRSAQGIFTGEPANNLGLMTTDTDSEISSLVATLAGRHLLGDVIGAEHWGVNLLEDLTLSYTRQDAGGIHTGELIWGSANAIAPDKAALLPGGTATKANYTGYSAGINGVMIDLMGLPPDAAPGADDLGFRVGNDNHPAGWAPAAVPASITVRPGEGAGGSVRLVLIWEDNAVEKQWLQVTVSATAQTGLVVDDVFYFGNAIGESGNSAVDAKVNAADMLAARDNPRNFLEPAEIDFPYDFNRDARVNSVDMLIARNNQAHFLNALKLITVPGPKAPGGKDVLLHDAVFEQSTRSVTLPGRLDWLSQLDQPGGNKKVSGPISAVSETPQQFLGQ